MFRGRKLIRPPRIDGPPCNMGPHPAWGPPPWGGWGPPPPGGWGPPPPDGWGPPPPDGWGPHPPDGWGPPPPDGWGPHAPDVWGPPPPNGWGPPPPDGWGPYPPDGWGPPPPGGWGPPPTGGWGPPPHGWGPESWEPSPFPPPPATVPPPPAGVPPPSSLPIPPLGFPSGCTGEVTPENADWPPGTTPAETQKTATESSALANAEDSAPKAEEEPAKATKLLFNLLGKREVDKPPAGRSTGIISFIGPSFGQIKREDQKKFSFSFKGFFGDPKAMKAGVRVHFTACKGKKHHIATDVKVAPGGTERVDPEIYEGVVSLPILEPQPGERQFPGQVLIHIDRLKTNLTFDRKDSVVTLLKDDRVLINLLTDIATEKRRATNIRPTIPSTFEFTKETREKGIIASVKDCEGVIRSDTHGELPFDIMENFSEIDFTSEDVNEEVEFTLHERRTGNQAIRIRRVKENLLLTLCSPSSKDTDLDAGKNSANQSTHDTRKLLPNMCLDPELYEGVVSQPIIEPKADMDGYPGQIHANIGTIRTNVTFDHRDCGVTLLKNDQVLLSLLVDMTTYKKRAANIKPKIPFTFAHTNEKRQLGVINSLGDSEGVLTCEEHGELPFDRSENFSDTEFSQDDVSKEVEFTVVLVKEKKRAVRMRRTKMVEDQIVTEKRRKEEEEQQKEKKRKEAVAAALTAAKEKWTPLGFNTSLPYSSDKISKERFDGTVLKVPTKPIKKEPKDEEPGGGAESAQIKANMDVNIKKEEEDQEVKTERPEEEKSKEEAGGGAESQSSPPEELGRLVMTVEGQQKVLTFGLTDMLTRATMLVGDKVRFNLATDQEKKAERATFVEILPSSFEESTKERRHGIVIEFSEHSGLIKCSEDPQLFFYMFEVIEKKKLELNEKVDFSIVPHEFMEGSNQAIRIKRFTENVFLPARKLCAAAASKKKMTINLARPLHLEKDKQKAEKLKITMKNLRAQDKKSSFNIRDYSCRRSPSRSRSRSPPSDKYRHGNKRRRSISPERDRKSSRYRRSISRKRSRRRSQSRSRSRSMSRDRSGRKRSKISREREGHKRRMEPSLPPRGRVDDELARKKRELEELNEMIAYKKSLVDPRGLDPGQRTCFDYDHGRVTTPEFKPVHSILKKRPDDLEYSRRLPPPYEDPYYGRPYHDSGSYSTPYARGPYGDPSYTDLPYESRLYGKPSHEGPSTSGRPYTDRYDVYEETYGDQYYDPTYGHQLREGPYHDTVKKSPSPKPSTQTRQVYSPTEALCNSPSPKRKSPTPPPVEKPPLHRFLDMLKKNVTTEKMTEAVAVKDELLPHEQPLEDGKGFSRIVGLVQEPPSSSVVALEEENKLPSPKQLSAEPNQNKTESFSKIQTLLRTFGLNLTKNDMTKLASCTQETTYRSRSSSTDREVSSTPQEDRSTTSSAEANLIHPTSSVSPSPLEPPSRRPAVSEYEEFLNQQELEALKKARELQSLTKEMGSTPSPKPPPGPPPAHCQHPSPPINWPPLDIASSLKATPKCSPATGRLPPGPPPGPPPRRSPGQPPFIGKPASALPLDFPAQAKQPLSSTVNEDQSTISSTVARCLKVIESVKSQSVKPGAKPLKSVQFSLTSESATNSYCPVVDIKSKQKEKLDLYNQKILEKRDQQYKEKRELLYQEKLARKQGKKMMFSPATAVSSEPKNVWICGHSLVYWAEMRATSPEVGMQLGMDPSKVAIWWKGVQGMTWPQLLPLLHQLKVTWPDPHVLVMHLGGNDMCTDSPTNLLASVKKDLTSMRTIFPHTLLVWSNILPRRVWRHSADAHEVDLVRSTVNRRIQNIVSELGGVSLAHDNIRCGSHTGLYRPDGIHLSHKGIDLFNLNLQDYLEKWEGEMNNTSE
ncbi:uncharacterized protein si:dkeyp-121d4.3 isoform X1 [Entelurus aequoreus]|uniref:uncharacterized protein si:dkeyp-121d4.3 isoform X1 n=1 Tax=Entelurus aequoreus TaxID=161455 RepID=UPI002B1D336F|nr:uncharacterized protein si:dkeyp-121d4.3 isoform X1 [Entelurus aequoreus]